MTEASLRQNSNIKSLKIDTKRIKLKSYFLYFFSVASSYNSLAAFLYLILDNSIHARTANVIKKETLKILETEIFT